MSHTAVSLGLLFGYEMIRVFQFHGSHSLICHGQVTESGGYTIIQNVAKKITGTKTAFDPSGRAI